MELIEFLKVIFLGIVEGITEWLPISSTGHLILVNEFLHLNMSEEFMNMFNVLIQLGAILAVILLFFPKLWPFSRQDKYFCKKDTWNMWFKIVVASIPVGVIGILFNDVIEEKFQTPGVVAATLIIYGILFILIEKSDIVKRTKANSIAEITYKMAFLIGVFQVLSIIPGTSRSGATIVGAMLFGCSRMAAAEFTFYLAIPAMIGASLVKLIKFGFIFTGAEIMALVTGMVVSFIVSVFAIRFLMSYIKKHNFVLFGWYRIVLGILVILYFAVAR